MTSVTTVSRAHRVTLLLGFLAVGAIFPAAHILAFDVTVYWIDASRDLILAAKAIVLLSATAVSLVGIFALKDVPGALRAPRWVVVLALGFLGWALVATAWASDTPFALGMVGLPIRFDGTYLFLCSMLIAYFLFAAVRAWPRLADLYLYSLAFAATITGTFATAQSLGIDAWGFIGINGLAQTAPSAFFSHSGLVSTLCGIAAISMLHVAAWPGQRTARALPLLLMVTNAVICGAMGGRASYLALGLITVASLVVMLVGRTGEARVSIGARHAVLLGALVLGVAFIGLGRQSASDLIRAVEGADTSWNSRMVTWQVALRMLGEQPVRPYGIAAFQNLLWENATEAEVRRLLDEHAPGVDVENIGRVGPVLTYYDPVLNTQQFIVTAHDKAHSYPLDVALALGSPGAILLVALVVSLLGLLAKSGSPAARAAFFGGALFAVFSLAWFPTLALDPIVWSLLGMGLGAAHPLVQSTAKSSEPADTVPDGYLRAVS